ncbi:MAG: hypothetical protein ABIG39_04550 [Candidatus Micrarchaeota archaeon]
MTKVIGDSVTEELVGLIPKKAAVDAVHRFKEEQQLYEKFGKEGMTVYMKIDGKKTMAEILTTTGIEESRLLEMINEMEKLGMIRVFTVFELEAQEENNK